MRFLEHGITGLVMITRNRWGDLCMSGKTIYGDLSKVDEKTLTYGGKHKFLKVYDRGNNANAYKLSTQSRALLWEREEEAKRNDS